MIHQRTIARGPVLHGLAQDIVRIQKRGDAPVAIWLAPELMADALAEVQQPTWQDFEIPVYSPVAEAIVLVPVRAMGPR